MSAMSHGVDGHTDMSVWRRSFKQFETTIQILDEVSSPTRFISLHRAFMYAFPPYAAGVPESGKRYPHEHEERRGCNGGDDDFFFEIYPFPSNGDAEMMMLLASLSLLSTS